MGQAVLFVLVIGDAIRLRQFGGGPLLGHVRSAQRALALAAAAPAAVKA